MRLSGLLFMIKNLLRDFLIPCQENDFKPRILETQFFFILLGLLIGLKILTLASFLGNFGATIFNQISQGDIYVLTNDARTANGIGKLQVSSKLEAAAQLKLADMFQNGYFAHISPIGINPWHWFDKANYNYKVAGENLAMSFMSSNDVMNAWLNSESHRKNLLLNDFQEIGIAVGSGIINGQQTVVVVQEFGTPRTQILAVQTKSVSQKNPTATPKPSVILKISPTPRVTSKLTPKVIPKPSLIPKISLTPKPVVKATPISLKNALATVPQVKSATVEKTLLPEYVSYFANDSFKKMLILFTAMAILILFLKVFVAFSIQHPVLILKSILLIVASLAFVLIKEDKFIFNNVQISDKAEINISDAK